MEEYLPPLVTKLKADLSDLVRGLAEARALVRDYAAGSHKDLVDAMADAGRDGGAIFGNEFKKTSAGLMATLDRDVGREVLNESRNIMSNAGREAGRSFSGGFRSILIPALIGALILLSPAIVTLVAAAITAGVSLGFIGLGAFLLREQPRLIAAAVNFKNTLSAVFKDAATPLLEPLINALNILSGVVKALAPDFKQIFATLAVIVEPLATGFGQMITAIMPGLKEMLGHPEIMLAFADGLRRIGEGLSEIFHQIAIHGPEITNFMSDFMHGMGNLLAGIGYLIGFMAVAYQKMDDLHNKAVSQGWDTPWNAIKTGAAAVGGAIAVAAAAVGRFFVAIYNAATGWLGKARDFIGAWMARVGGFFASLPGRVWAAISAIPGILRDAAVTAFDAFFYWTAYGIAKVTQFVITLPDTFQNIFMRVYIAVVQWIQRTGQEVQQVVESLPGRISAALSQMWQNAVSWATRLYWDFVTWIYKMIQSVGNYLDSLPSRAARALDQFLTFSKNFLINMARSWYEAGKNLLMSLVHGVEDAMQVGIDIVERALRRVYEGAKNALGIHSPSVLFAELGSFTMKGYIQGLLSQRGALDSVWGRMPMPAMAGISNGQSVAMAAAAAPSYRPSGGNGDGAMLEATFNLDGIQLMTALVPVAQRQKQRTGETGLS